MNLDQQNNAGSKIELDNLQGSEIAAFLEEHIQDMRAFSPPESKHALDLAGLRKPEITFWTLRQHGVIAGCCALKQLDAEHGEIKSMRTSGMFRRQGIGARLLTHVISEAQERGYRRLSLETGAMPFFEPARSLYRKFGFQECAPFAAYKPDPNSVFMTRLV
ncbi:MAG TPA: GNAT family N-acetyltransferase [Verrucomicrobiae bacterium]|nr:GNAT family N-acetyltransferase [Verrucomicrobiae bacterium]